MAKFDIKRALFFSLVLMLLLGVFLSGFAMGKAQAAKAESIRVYIRGGEWEVFDLTDSSTVFPDGMSYDRVNKRLILDGYNSGPIQSISSKPDDLDIFVKSNSSISLGRSSCINCFIVSKDLLFFKNVNISGNPGTELNLTTKWFKALSNNVHVSDITLKINVNNIYSGKACGADHLTLKNDAKLISNVYGSETSTKSACGIGNLTMMDTSEAKIFVKCKSPYDLIVNGVDNLYLRGTGKLDIDLSGGAYQQAIKFMPSIPEGYIKISGDWDHPKVVYVYFDSSSPTPTPTPSPSPTPTPTPSPSPTPTPTPTPSPSPTPTPTPIPTDPVDPVIPTIPTEPSEPVVPVKFAVKFMNGNKELDRYSVESGNVFRIPENFDHSYKRGYLFECWTSNGKPVGNVFVVNKNFTLRAQYKALPKLIEDDKPASIRDVIVLLQYTSKVGVFGNLSNEEMVAKGADLDGDGKVDIVDVIIYLKSV